MFRQTGNANAAQLTLFGKAQADEKNKKTNAEKNAAVETGLNLSTNRYVFSQEEFKRIMSKSKSGVLAQRITEVIIPNTITEQEEDLKRFMLKSDSFDSMQRLQEAFVARTLAEPKARIFYLYWTYMTNTKHMYPIKVTYQCQDDFYYGYSRFLTQENFSHHFPGYFNPEYRAKLKICTLRVEELGGFDERASLDTSGKVQYTKLEDKQLLFMWFTLDGYLGELRTSQAGRYISAAEVMTIYQYFAEFLRLENTYICDNTMLNSENMKISIPLRVISAIATDKTWFQQKMRNVRLVDKAKVRIGERQISQRADMREKALNDLQSMLLKTWHDMLDDKQKLMLMTLCKNLKMNFKKATLKDLAASIYAETEEGLIMTPDLETFSILLTGNERSSFDKMPLVDTDAAKEIKSNIHELLWGSYLWRHDGVSKNTLIEEGKQDERINNRL